MESMINAGSGAIIEQFDVEMQKVLENIMDPNTEAKTARKIQINITFSPTEDREIVSMACVTKSTLAPAKEIKANICVIKDRQGNLAVSEIKPKQNYYMEEST